MATKKASKKKSSTKKAPTATGSLSEKDVKEIVARAMLEFAECLGGAYGTAPVCSAAMEAAKRIRK